MHVVGEKRGGGWGVALGPSSGSASSPLGQINLRSSPKWSCSHAAKCHFCKRTREPGRNRTCGLAGRDPSRFSQGNHNTGNEPERQILDQVQSKSVSPIRLHPRLLSRLTFPFEVTHSKKKANSELFSHISIIPFCL